MALFRGLLLAAGLLVLGSLGADAGKKMVCYYGGWAPYRNGEGTFVIEDIDPFICTHAMYGFAALHDDGRLKVFDPWMDLEEDWGKGGYIRFNNMKLKNPNLKTFIAMGGWNEGSVRYSQIFSDPAKRQVYVNDAVSFLKKYGFDGLDLDWEYPGQRGGSAGDIATFSSLVKELRAEFDKHGFLLSAAVAAAEKSFIQSYDVPVLGQYLDFINIMAYDYHGAWENVTGQNAPLYTAATEYGTDFAGYSADASIQAWISHGAPAEKLVMGVGLYGRSFTLANAACVNRGCSAKAAGTAGPLTGEAGMLGYNEICKMEQQPGAQVFWDDEQKVPYLALGDQWVGYDNEESARLKVDYIKKYNLGGAMVWSIDTDDFRGTCGKGKYPVLSVLKNGMDGASGTESAPPATTTTTTTLAPASSTPAAATTTTTTTDATTTTTTTTDATTTTTTTPAAPSSGPCKQAGYNRDPADCATFYQCTLLADGSYKYSKFTCSGGLAFDLTKNTCNYKDQVDCTA